MNESGYDAAAAEVMGASTRKTVSALYSEHGAYITRVASDTRPGSKVSNKSQVSKVRRET